MDKCAFCGATIRWATTAAGRFVPLDPEPLGLPAHAHYILDAKGTAHCIGEGPFRTHFDSCPAGRAHFAGREGGQDATPTPAG